MEKLLDVPMSQIAEDAVFLPDATSNNDYPLLSKQFFRRHGRDLFACASTWFLVDIVFYCSQLFQSQIYISYLPDGQNVYQDAYNVARLGAIVAVCSTIPGYFATVYFIDRVGRVKIQIMGFFFMAIGLLSIGIPYYNERWDEKAKTGFMFLYGLTFFFSNFGPNTTTFIVPAELFPARFRSTCHGISGAAGKVGAIIGAVGFLWASHNQNEGGYPKAIGMTAVLVILGGVCIVGMVITYFFTRETMGRSLEENENEDDEYAEMWVLRCFKGSCAVPPESSVAANEGGYPKAIGMTAVLVILGGVCIVGMVITYFFTRETMGRSLEENENEDDEYAEMWVLRCFKGSCAVPPESSVAAV
ncbi:hypothetical protein RJ640_020675 [Escallonia rubra]|uniref:Major facilitator superfamily (MFS) profile domain-containing protein n=1 Tax=Escallonia rubra TaxID=112253 RepID=A0AA88RN31_9ASTE|nr:hypothetical protein RJ640_020675 [Escallonia rubra]